MASSGISIIPLALAENRSRAWGGNVTGGRPGLSRILRMVIRARRGRKGRRRRRVVGVEKPSGSVEDDGWKSCWTISQEWIQTGTSLNFDNVTDRGDIMSQLLRTALAFTIGNSEKETVQEEIE
ncbi:uncharacterized protein LOC108622891 isoform X1 [Ceratina calcarata]|uniref:Uncharacterized protein LOC108622891 isoform X1 n=1 Tax=Ceratina calcarata TaxID=156304 RepID=A0AAJ7RYY9_9HYME|nr:uncharacterized protein LOC108622891 isoform X1 [Ceratina calcarata]